MLNEIVNIVKKKINFINSLQEIHQIKVEFLGKSSVIQQEIKKLSSLNILQRKEYAKTINVIKQKIKVIIDLKTEEIKNKILKEKFEKERIDLTIPARSINRGNIHPITQCIEELIQVFTKYNFNIKSGPEIETDWYNFTALNIDKYHPARQMHDTFYLKEVSYKSKILRTHTSSVQIKVMEKEKPPFRFISYGKAYRADSDLTHTPMFHQIEGLVIDRDINMSHLKYIITDFITTFFEKNIEIQFRPSYFPFTEPSAEVDIKMNKKDKWLEVLGCGMVHPKVLTNVNIDPNIYKGFAFGLGIERFAMLKYNIKDLRQFFTGDIRWLKHYNFDLFNIPSIAGGLSK